MLVNYSLDSIESENASNSVTLVPRLDYSVNLLRGIIEILQEKRIELKRKLKKQKILRFPGAYNPLTAKLITEIGFDGIYISGAVMSNDLGVPDIGLTTLKEVSYRANQISRVSDLPSIVDADTGFKNCKNISICLDVAAN